MAARERILQTAGRLFAIHGYADTSLSQVAREAGVSKALILWYFETKERLFQTALQHFLAPYAIDENMLRGLNAHQQLEKLITDYSEFIAENVDSVKFMLGQVVREEENAKDLVAHVSDLYRVYRSLLATILERGRQTGHFTSRVKPTEDAALIMATLNGVLVQQIVEPDNAETLRGLLTRARQVIHAHLSGSADTRLPPPPLEPPTADPASLER